MLTAKFWQNLLTRRFFLLLFLIVIVLFSVWIIAANLFLATYKQKLTRYLSVNFRAPIAISSITYDFPDKVSLNRIRVFKNIHGVNRPVFVVRRVFMPFKIGDLLWRRNFVCRRAYVQGCELFSRETGLFWKENGKYVKDFFANFSGKKKFTLDVDGVLSLYTGVDSVAKISFYNTLIMYRGGIDILGSFETGEKFFNKPVSYSANIFLSGHELDIKALKVASEGFYSSFWGNLNEGVLKLNGYCQNTPPILPVKSKKGILALYDNRTHSAKLVGSEQDIWNIYDIDLAAVLSLDSIHVSNLTFSLGDIPVKFTGDMVFGDSVKVDIGCDISTLKAAFKGKFLNGIFNGTGKVVSTRSADSGKSVREETNILFDDLSFQSLGPRSLSLHCGGLLYEYNAAVAAHRLEFRNFNFTMDNSKRKKFFEADADLYDGFCGFNGVITPSDARFFECNIGITAVSTKNLRSLLSYFDSIDGKLSGKMRYRAGDDSEFSGHLVMDTGALYDFSFFVWLANTFSLDDMRHIQFTRLSLDFFVAKNILKMENIKLLSPDIGLDGYYDIANDMVSSKLSLSMSRSVLKKSPKFSPLLSLVGSDFDPFPFDFQLSGLISSVNFKWLGSEFKSRLQRAIPGFIERGIEKKVEDIISSDAEKNQ